MSYSMSRYIKIYYNSRQTSKQYCNPQRRWKSLKLHPFFIKKETKGFNEVGAKTFLNMKKALGRGKHWEQFQWSSGGVDKEAEKILRAEIWKRPDAQPLPETATAGIHLPLPAGCWGERYGPPPSPGLGHSF